MNILFINAGRRCELVRAFKKVLPSLGGGGLVYASDINPLAPALQFADESVIFPHTSDSKFLQTFIDFCREKEIDLLIPTIDPDLTLLDALRGQISEYLPDLYMLLPSSEVIELADDKRKTRAAFAEFGALVPTEVDVDDELLEFPVFIKPAKGSAGIGAQKVNDRAELEACLRQLEEPMVESLIEGPEYTVDVFCSSEGRALLSIPRKRLAVRGGEVSRGVIERCGELEKLAGDIAAGLGCTGPVTLQFRKTDQGYVAMELNARVGGGLPLTIAAGGDWPQAIMNLAAGNKVELADFVQDEVVISRFDESVFIRPEKEKGPKPDLSSKKVAIFDMDDTLFAERDFVYGAYHAVSTLVVEKYGVFIEDELRRRFDEGQRGDLFTTALRSFGIEISEQEALSLVKIYRSHTPHLYPYTDVAAVDYLKQEGIKTGLISDGHLKVQQKKFTALNLSRYFDEVIFTDSFGREFWKPHPMAFESMAEKFAVETHEMIYVGDNPKKDFVSCRDLGIYTLRIRRHRGESSLLTAHSEAYEADYEIKSLLELKELFLLD